MRQLPRQLPRHFNEAPMNRRRFVHWLSTLPLWHLLGRRAIAQSAPLSKAELVTLRDVAGVVLPSALGESRIDAVASDFVVWIGAYKPGAEMSTGYGFPRMQSLPGNPSAHYAAQLRDLAPKLAGGKREAVVAALEEAKVDRIPPRPNGKHVAADLMSYFYAGSEGQDFLYGVAIKRDDCRGLANSGDRPPAWS
jgi:hypothetical protein